MATSSSTPEEQARTAKEREIKEHQESMRRYALACALRVILPLPKVEFERIDDAAEIERLKENIRKTHAAGSAGAISTTNPCVVTNVDDKDGTFKVRVDGKEIPDYLIYVQKGVITSSVSSANFKLEDAQFLVSKAIAMGKDLELQVGSDHERPDWKRQTGNDNFLAIRELRALEKLIQAASMAGQPFKLGISARTLLRHFNDPKLEERYLEAERNSAENAKAINLVAAATKDAVLSKLLVGINDLPAITNVTAFNSAVTALATNDEKLNAIAARLDELKARAEKSEEAAKELKANAEGAVKLLTEIGSSGAQMFRNYSERQPNTERDMERQIQICESVVENVKDRFTTGSIRNGLEAVVNSTSKEVKNQIAECEKLLNNLKFPPAGTAPLSPSALKEVEKLEAQMAALAGRANGADKAIKDANTEVAKVAGLATTAENHLAADRKQFTDNVGRAPAKRM